MEEFKCFYPYELHSVFKTNDIIVDLFQGNTQYIMNELTRIARGEQPHNFLKLKNVMFNASMKNPQDLCQIIWNFFQELSLNVYNEINELYKTHQLTVSKFNEIYREYNSKFFRIAKYLDMFDDLFVKQAKTKYSHTNLIKNYLFYCNVVNGSYTLDESSQAKCLYQVMTEILVEDMDIDHLISLYKVYGFYTKMGQIPRLNHPDKEPFKANTEVLFLATVAKELNQYIHALIIECSSLGDQDNSKSSKTKIMNLLNYICQYYPNKELFMKYYELFFETRLFLKNFNNQLELDLINMNCMAKFDLRKSVTLKIKDQKDNVFSQRMCQKLELNIVDETGKYGKLDLTQVDIKKLQSHVFRNVEWNIFAKKGDGTAPAFILPADIQIYLDLYRSVYGNVYPHRKLTWDSTLGNTVVNLKFNTQVYQLILSFQQVALLYQFKSKSTRKANEIAKNLGIKLKDLAPILNQFIRLGLLIRNSKFKQNDPEMELIFNRNFTYKSNKISLVA